MSTVCMKKLFNCAIRHQFFRCTLIHTKSFKKINTIIQIVKIQLQIINDELIVQYRVGIKQHSPNHVSQTHNDQTDQPEFIQTIIILWQFSTPTGKHFSILSSNIQSIHAKCNKVEAYLLQINQIQINFSVICIQEFGSKKTIF